MKRWMIALLLIVVAAAAGAFRGTSGKFGASDAATATKGEGREEIRRSYQLSEGANVEVRGINGPVSIETADTNTAEVYVLRTAQSESDLENGKITITGTATSLLIEGEQNSGGLWRRMWHGEVKQQVTLKVPRQIALTVKGVNGAVSTGEVTGAVQISGINGKVLTAQTVGYSEISGVNGSLTVALRQLGEKGIRISGVNGAIELRFSSKLNADLDVRGINGRVKTDLPDVVVQGEPDRSNYSARIGTGGAPINMSGINGSVRLTRDTAATSE
ncbi:MAG TPA: hypothetical protein VE842_20120 [Pyrinomonadaceae bacterium]|nr:hypothetical protein [Pyrinomonadaceae bacterium]